MKEDSFEGMLRKFYASHVGARASTESFRRVVEEYTREDMKWFFDQWVYGTAIPTYQYAYQVEVKPDGRYDLNLRVDQLNVPENFRMPVVLSVVLEDGRSMRMRVVVSGKSRQYKIPNLPGKPEEIIFNEFESVLCEVEEVRW
jgi:aminopeptidase N